MKVSFTISTENIDREEFTAWLLSEFPGSEWSLSNIISGDGLYAEIWKIGLSSEPITWKVTIKDLHKAARFEEKWNWWILEKWYEYDLGYTYEYKDDERDWFKSCIKPADRKDFVNRLAFKHYEDLQRYELVFGKEHLRNDLAHAESMITEVT
jgi:hypothetical protein